jgi:hypothetical protein
MSATGTDECTLEDENFWVHWADSSRVAVATCIPPAAHVTGSTEMRFCPLARPRNAQILVLPINQSRKENAGKFAEGLPGKSKVRNWKTLRANQHLPRC